jgi:ribonuclease-3
VLEAIIGGIYLEVGHDVAAERIADWFATELASLSLSQTQKDPKTRLQEYLQARALAPPEYKVINVEGKSHDQIFTVQCCGSELPPDLIGEGASRKIAEQNAATAALKMLQLD